MTMTTDSEIETGMAVKKSLHEVFDGQDRRNWFRPVDTDAPGGFARAVQVSRILNEDVDNEKREALFKVMRYDVLDPKIARRHFLSELELLVRIEKVRPQVSPENFSRIEPITRVYDSGFVPIELPELLDKYRKPTDNTPVYQTKLDVAAFSKLMRELDPNKWVPYIVVELANYNDSLFRQIQRRPDLDQDGLFRLPTAEVVYLAIRLLDTMIWLHKTLNIAYIDWKPEHVYWNGRTHELKLIDWNVTWPLETPPGRQQNIRDDIRLFTGAVLYCGLTLIDPEFGTAIGPRPTSDIKNAVPEIRKRYWTDNPQFYDAGSSLDDRIKGIVKQGLDPSKGFSTPDELQAALIEYLHEEFKLTPKIFENGQDSDYLRAVQSIRSAQENLKSAYSHVTDATRFLGQNPELNRLAKIIKIAQERLP